MTEHQTEILRLSQAPIVDFVCEVRFEATVPRLGDILAKSLVAAFPDLIGPPARSGPELPFSFALPPGVEVAFGAQMNQLVFEDGMVLNVAERAVGIGVAGPYRGWENLEPRIRQILSVVLSSPLISKISRCSVKYTNFFPGASTIAQVLNARLELGKRTIGAESTQIRTEFKEGDDVSIIQILNPANVDGRVDSAKGLVLDIDCIRVLNLSRDIDVLMDQLKAVHSTEKNLFFELLSAETLTAMGPVYA